MDLVDRVNQSYRVSVDFFQLFSQAMDSGISADIFFSSPYSKVILRVRENVGELAYGIGFSLASFEYLIMNPVKHFKTIRDLLR